jgi:hypothetical protein
VRPRRLDDASQSAGGGQGQQRVEGTGKRITADDAVDARQNADKNASQSLANACRKSSTSVPIAGSR